MNKFRDGLLRSSEQLQSHVLQLCHGRVPLHVRHLSLESRDSYAYCILVYRIGQLLCWISLLENDIRTIHYIPTVDDHYIMDILYAIHRGLADSMPLHGQEMPLQIFSGLQDSIGELMPVTVGDSEKGTQRCMGYPEFWKRWTVANNNEFRPWFSQIEEGLRKLSRSKNHQLQDQSFLRVMQFQHLLIQLAIALDPKNTRVHTRARTRIETPFLTELCTCTYCMSMKPFSYSESLTCPI